MRRVFRGVHLVETRVRIDNTIRGICATFGIRLCIGQGERFLARMQVAASVPGLGEAVASLLGARERLVQSGAGHEVDDHDWAVAPPEAGTGSAGLGHLVPEEQAAKS